MTLILYALAYDRECVWTWARLLQKTRRYAGGAVTFSRN